jgi:hypothetical protein
MTVAVLRLRRGPVTCSVRLSHQVPRPLLLANLVRGERNTPGRLTGRTAVVVRRGAVRSDGVFRHDLILGDRVWGFDLRVHI